MLMQNQYSVCALHNFSVYTKIQSTKTSNRKVNVFVKLLRVPEQVTNIWFPYIIVFGQL